MARSYLKILEILGVETSPSKTYISSELCEFAKRLVHRGVEITPFPISSISNQSWSIPLVVAAIRGEERKGFYPIKGIPSAVRVLQEMTNLKAGKVYLSTVFSEAFLCEMGIKLLSGEISASTYFSTVGGDLYPKGVEGDDQEFELLTFNLLSIIFQNSLGTDGKVFGYYSGLRSLHLKSCGSLDWPEFEKVFPVLQVLLKLSGDLFRLESDMGAPIEKNETWRTLVKGMFNPFALDPLGTDPPKRTSRASHRLGRLVLKTLRSPEAFSKFLTTKSPTPITDRGLVITLRTTGGLRDEPVFRVEHEALRGLVWNQVSGKWEPRLV